MCAPGCIAHVRAKLSRRSFFKGASAVAVGAAAVSLPSGAAEARTFSRFKRVRDLTHTLTPEFPTFFGVSGIGMLALI